MLRRSMWLVPVCVAAMSLSACQTTPEAGTGISVQRSGLETLAGWMSGSFSSQEQAARDDDYFDIRLEMVRIWPDANDDAVWIYVEQATAQAIDRPYRQRVYRLTETGPGAFESAVFELPGDPMAFAGWWQHPERFAVLEAEHLEQLQGCSVFLEYDPDREMFHGGTNEGTCPSSLRGASYVMSEVTLTPSAMLTWDRGFDSQGQQVWGATAGGYEFRRIN